MSKRTKKYNFYTLEQGDIVFPGFDKINMETVENLNSELYRFVGSGVIDGWDVYSLALPQKGTIDYERVINDRKELAEASNGSELNQQYISIGQPKVSTDENTFLLEDESIWNRVVCVYPGTGIVGLYNAQTVNKAFLLLPENPGDYIIWVEPSQCIATEGLAQIGFSDSSDDTYEIKSETCTYLATVTLEPINYNIQITDNTDDVNPLQYSNILANIGDEVVFEGVYKNYQFESYNITVRPVNVPSPKISWDPDSYVPNYEIGAYYFPRWRNYIDYSPLELYPERIPVLGTYRDGDVEAATWNIKWAVEHGITFFCYDYYWDHANNRPLWEHAIKAHLQSPFKKYLKWCICYSTSINNTYPFTDNIWMHWIDNLCTDEQYFKIDNKPVINFFQGGELYSYLGNSRTNVKDLFTRIENYAISKGFSGVHFWTCSYPDQTSMNYRAEEGWDVITGYNYPKAGSPVSEPAKPYSFPYDDNMTGYQGIWDSLFTQTRNSTATIFNSDFTYVPVVTNGRDGRPWWLHLPENGGYYISGKSATKFEQLLTSAKQRMDNVSRVLVSGKKIIMVEAWNETGEGEFFQPHKLTNSDNSTNFSYLNAIRKVFLGNYQLDWDIPNQESINLMSVDNTINYSGAEFNSLNEIEGLPYILYNLKSANCKNGIFEGISSNAAFIRFPWIDVRPSDHHYLKFRIKNSYITSNVTGYPIYLAVDDRVPIVQNVDAYTTEYRMNLWIRGKFDGNWHTYVVNLDNLTYTIDGINPTQSPFNFSSNLVSLPYKPANPLDTKEVITWSEAATKAQRWHSCRFDCTPVANDIVYVDYIKFTTS